MLVTTDNPVSVLLFHNALVVIVAVRLAQFIRRRSLISLLAVMMGLAALTKSQNVDAVRQVAWWEFVQEPLSGFYEPFTLGTMCRWPDLVGCYGLIVVVISPLVFAYCAAYQWTVTGNETTSCVRIWQIRMRTLLVITTSLCLVLGYNEWVRNSAVLFYPTCVTALLLVVRPFRWCMILRDRWHDNDWLVEWRAHLRGDRGTSNENRPTVHHRFADLARRLSRE